MHVNMISTITGKQNYHAHITAQLQVSTPAHSFEVPYSFGPPRLRMATPPPGAPAALPARLSNFTPLLGQHPCLHESPQSRLACWTMHQNILLRQLTGHALLKAAALLAGRALLQVIRALQQQSVGLSVQQNACIGLDAHLHRVVWDACKPEPIGQAERYLLSATTSPVLEVSIMGSLALESALTVHSGTATVAAKSCKASST